MRQLCAFVVFSITVIFGELYVGNVNINDRKVDSLNITGDAFLKNVDVGELTILGPLTFSGLSAKSIKITGPVKGEKAKQINKLSLTGPLMLVDGVLREVNMTGPCELNRVEIQKLMLVGPLDVECCQLRDVMVTATDISVKYSRIDQLYVKQTTEKKDQVVELKGDSQVGAVIFESGKGKVRVKGQGVKLGTVQGAAFEHVCE